MKKVILSALALIVAILLLVACDGNNDRTPEITEYVDGAPATATVEKGNYVVFVKPSDDSRWFSWDYEGWEIKNVDPSLDYSVYFFKVDALFDSVEALETADNVSADMLVGTKSYRAGLGRGGAIFKIVDKKPIESGVLTIKTLSLYACVTPFSVNGERIITVEQFGARGDGERADQSRINVAFKFENADVIEFESPVYIQEDTINLNRGDVRINGKGAEIHNRYDRVVVGKDFLIAGKSADDPIKNIIVENLTLKCTEGKGKGTLYNEADHIQFGVMNVHSITVRNCSMLVPQNENTDPLQVASVWMNGAISDIVFENNYLQNFSDSGMGGGLWFSAGEGKYGCKNLIVRNNHVEKNSCDEVFALFFGEFENVIVENNYFYTHSHVYPDRMSENGIGFGAYDIKTHCKNIKFSNNEVRMSVRFNAFIFSQADNIEISDNKIYLTSNFGDQPDVEEFTIIAKGLFRLAEHDKYEVTNTKIHNNYIEVNCGDFTENGYNLNALTEGMSGSVEYYDNEYVLNCIVNKFIGDNDQSKFYNNKITINGGLLNNNFSAEAQNSNQIIINQK